MILLILLKLIIRRFNMAGVKRSLHMQQGQIHNFYLLLERLEDREYASDIRPYWRVKCVHCGAVEDLCNRQIKLRKRCHRCYGREVKNTLGVRLINTLLHRYFITGGDISEKVAKATTFQKKLDFIK